MASDIALMNSSSGNGLQIAARSCTVGLVEEDEATAFLVKHHRQGTVKAKATYCGLFYQGELVGLASFGAPRTALMKRSYSRELLRLAFKGNLRIMGGASKLLVFYRKTFNPADIFTYQDTSGETSEVYSHCGFTLVKTNKTKTYLVAPGKTLSTAERQEALGMAYAVRFGPDRILGTKLGERYREDGTRKTNRELFLEELGWHEETTSGDRLYEWINPNYTFYTYKITASDSDKYYYGVSHVKQAKATAEDCLKDGYWGSGGGGEANKFRTWKKKHEGKLQKEVLAVFPRQAQAYAQEKLLIGDLWKTDPLCLNSASGGKDGGMNGWKEGARLHKAFCTVHGETIFIGDRCRRCITAATVHEDTCPVHGVTAFFGKTCGKCSIKDRNSLKECPVHGPTKFQGEQCYKCLNTSYREVKLCPVHGESNFAGGTCLRCAHASTEGECPIHGTAAFVQGLCMKCRNSTMNHKDICAIHGETTFKGGRCYKCWGAKSVTQQECSVHGLTKFRKGACCKCTYAAKNILMKECSRHGLTKHLKANCYVCQGEKANHTRFHKTEASTTCYYCKQEKG